MLVAAAVVLLTLSAKIQIPMWPVPMTMQTYVVLVIGMGYGTKLGLLSVGSYIALGVLGFPVFAGTPERGVGLPYVFGPTGGYLLGFVLAAGTCGALAKRGWDRHLLSCVAAMTVAHAVIFACGVAWLATMTGWERAVAVGFTPFVAATIVKTMLAAASLPAAWHITRRYFPGGRGRLSERSGR
jgi:biotin transport system substrate-specific component